MNISHNFPFLPEYAGHGMDIARELDVVEYDMIVICSGDGLMYEVWELSRSFDMISNLISMR